MALTDLQLANYLTRLETLVGPLVTLTLDDADRWPAVPARVDVLTIVDMPSADRLLDRCNLPVMRPSVIRLGWRRLPVVERFRAVRRFERLGYVVDELQGEFVARLPDPQPVVSEVSDEIVLYVISYNAPGQFALWLDSVEAAAPELLRLPKKFLLDNSTRQETRPVYDALGAPYDFTILRHGNLGISGGRRYCAEHFEALRAFGMLWFEDDMQLAPSDMPVCRNGFITRVPGLLERARAIVIKERLDILKLSFTEFFGDHHLNWAWHSADARTRREEFPGGLHRTRIDFTGVDEGVSYAVGEFHYSHWPSLMTRRANQMLFLRSAVAVHEQEYKASAFRLMRDGKLRTGALLASPIWHDRSFHYTAEERREY